MRADTEPGPARGRARALWLALVFLVSAGVLGNPLPPRSAPSLRLSPDTVRMGAFYGGATVRIEGEAPPGADVVVVIRGAEEPEIFNRKARVGPVWVNVDRVHVSGMPSLFLRLGGGELQSLLDPASVDAYRLDERALTRGMRCRTHCRCRVGEAPAGGSDTSLPCPTGADPDERSLELIRTSFLALKADEGSYQVHPDAVRVSTSATGSTLYAAELDWPRRARPGSYRVEALACRDRSVLGRTSANLLVVSVGFPARMGALSRTHAAAYGAGAVLAAAAAGFAMDLLVRRRRPRRPSPLGKAPPAAPPVAEPAEAAHEEQAEPVELVGSGKGG